MERPRGRFERIGSFFDPDRSKPGVAELGARRYIRIGPAGVRVGDRDRDVCAWRINAVEVDAGSARVPRSQCLDQRPGVGRRFVEDAELDGSGGRCSGPGRRSWPPGRAAGLDVARDQEGGPDKAGEDCEDCCSQVVSGVCQHEGSASRVGVHARRVAPAQVGPAAGVGGRLSWLEHVSAWRAEHKVRAREDVS
jgi:hypothetical protein